MVNIGCGKLDEKERESARMRQIKQREEGNVRVFKRLE